RDAGADRRRQPVDAVSERELHGALVRLAADTLRRSRAAAGRRMRRRPVPRPVDPAGADAVTGIARSARSLVSRAADQLLSLHRAVLDHGLERRRSGREPVLHPDRRGGTFSVDPALHRPRVLGVSRQGGRDRGVPLKRIAWFAALWLAGVMTTAAVAYLIRWAIGP